MIHNDAYVWAAIVGLTLVTVLTRASFLVLGDHIPLPEGLRRALRYGPAAALVAIIVPDLMPWKIGIGPVFDLKLVAAVVAVVVFLRFRGMTSMIAAGMMALWGLRWVVG